MNKKLIASLTIIGSICYFGSDLTIKEIPEVAKTPEVKTAPSIRSIHETYVTRRPGSQPKEEEVIESKERTFNKTRKKNFFEGTSHSALPSGFKFAKNVYAVKKDNFNSSMGEVVEEKNGFVFFNSDSRSGEANHVVVETKSQRLFTISSVLKVENVDEALRNTLVAKGFEEHYYHENLKIMYVQSSQEDLLRLHQELSEYKLNPQIEVLRGFHRLK
jgi:hypothetical protein